MFTIDSSLLRSFKITERQRVDLRFDLFNALNHFNVSGVNNVSGLDINNPVGTFGRVTQTAPGRQFQFSARYAF